MGLPALIPKPVGLPDNASGRPGGDPGLPPIYATGLGGVGQGLTDLVQLPYDIVIALLYLPPLPFVLAAG